MKKTDRIFTAVKDIFFIVLGSAVYALSVDFFTAPNNIAPGGITGVATLINYLISFPIGTTALILNIPLLIWGVAENGMRFLMKTAVATVLCSLLIDLFALIPYNYVGDTLLASLFGGLLSGAGLAMIFCRGGTTGGTDIIARNIHRRVPYVSMGSIILISDAVVIFASAVVYGSIENALYAVIAIFVSTKVIDAVTYGFSRDNGKLMVVVTDIPEELSKKILLKIQRGVTVMRGRGGFSKTRKGVLLVALRPTQVFKAKSLINETDPRAFIIVTTATAISGEGFRSISY